MNDFTEFQRELILLSLSYYLNVISGNIKYYEKNNQLKNSESTINYLKSQYNENLMLISKFSKM